MELHISMLSFRPARDQAKMLTLRRSAITSPVMPSQSAINTKLFRMGRAPQGMEIGPGLDEEMASKGGRFDQVELARKLLGKMAIKVKQVELARDSLQMVFTIERVSIIEHLASVQIV